MGVAKGGGRELAKGEEGYGSWQRETGGEGGTGAGKGRGGVRELAKGGGRELAKGGGTGAGKGRG